MHLALKCNLALFQGRFKLPIVSRLSLYSSVAMVESDTINDRFALLKISGQYIDIPDIFCPVTYGK